jgi:aldehyde dehydrogenase (NAD+)
VGWFADLAETHEYRRDLGVRDTLGGPARRWVEQVPVGVVAAITPWNVPNQINLAKVAPETPWTGLALGRIAAEHTDLPAGVLNVVTAQDKAFGELLTTDPAVDLISFTGSTATGTRVMEAAASNLTRVFLELGGKSVHLVLDDVADMGTAAAHAAFGTATVAGQGVEAIAAMLSSLAVGDPRDPGTVMGPLISRTQLERVDGYVRGALDAGARVVCGGTQVADLPGWFYEPTLLADVDNTMAVAREEIFGPVLVAIPFEDDDDAVAIANDSDYGLSGAVFSDDRDRALAVARRIRTGTMSVNGGVWYGPDVPFGGFKRSGIGREMGVEGFEEHLEVRAYAEPV